MKHTPGPWRFLSKVGYINGSDGIGPFGPREVQIGTVGDYRDKELLPFNKERWDADGRLIAAAPDLLAALEAMMSDYRSEGCPDPSCVVCRCSKAAEQLARAAIAKATGEQS